MGKTRSKDQSREKERADKACVHCGDPCGAGAPEKDGRVFCCAGCLTVYDLLHEQGLKTYYTLDNQPGLRPDRSVSANRLAYLDRDNIRTRLLDFDDGQTARVRFTIPQIHCSSCIWLLEHLYRLNEFVLNSRVNFQRRQVAITFDISRLPLSGLVDLMSSLGYKPEINLTSLDGRQPDRSYRWLYARLAVAGFAFGNIMLLSFPRYLGLDGATQGQVGDLFDWLKIGLGILVVTFGAFDFYRAAWLGLRQRQMNMDVPISLGIVVVFLRSLPEILIVGGAGYMDSLAALVFLLLIGRLYQKKTYFSVTFDRDYKSYLPIAVLTRTDDGEFMLPLDEVAVGQRLVIRNREIVPADAVLIAGEGAIDYSFVTGESDPVKLGHGDRLFAGGRQTGPTIEVEVVKEPSRSYLLQLWEQVEAARRERPGLASLANRISAYFTPAVLALAAAAGGFWAFYDASRAWNAATAVLIVACPCALALASPFALGTAQRLMGRARIFLRDSTIVERMARLTTLVFDKTGTITESATIEPVYVGPGLTDSQRGMILSLVRQSSHPLSIRLANALADDEVQPVTGFTEELGCGLKGNIGGHDVLLGSARWVGLAEETSLGAAVVHIKIDNDHFGSYQFANAYRPGLRDVMHRLSEGYDLTLLSGDTDRDRRRVNEIMGDQVKLHFDQSPQQKLEHIRRRVDAGEMVAMVGDGLNDAGALRAATVGLAVVEDSSSFSPASDGVVNAGSFRRLPDVFGLARDTVKVIKLSFAVSILYNIIGLGFAVSGRLSPVVAAILMPASSVTVVLISTLLTAAVARRRGVI